jgi:Protein of unknown function (DUF3619)
VNRAALQAHQAHRQQALEARFGLRVAAALSERAVGHDIEQRLRVAREQALARASAVRRPAVATGWVRSGNGQLALNGSPWWWRLASLAPLVVLAFGLLMVERLDLDEQIRAAAEIDTVLLADELPPRAYTDPGFAEFLRQAHP